MKKKIATKLDYVRLEDRNAPAVFTVTNTNDSGSGSLRDAIISANTTAGADSITFNLAGANVRTIALTTALPLITEQVIVDGTSQAGYAGVPLIELNGSAITATNASGLYLFNTSNSIVRGLTINGFRGSGVRIDSGSNNTVVANLLGTNAAGTAASANFYGVQISNSTGNTIGGTSASERNILSGNSKSGIRIDNNATNNNVFGNFIGTSLNGSVALANDQQGIELATGATKNTIGGTLPGSGNIIAGNKGVGVLIFSTTTAGNIIQGNRIGVGFNGLSLPNLSDGIRAESGAGSNPTGGLTISNSNLISKNTIASNGGNGVAVRDTSRGIRIEENSISSNTGLGIDISSTANGGLPIPVITGTTFNNTGGITLQGTIAGPASTQIKVEFFGSAVADPSGFGEGQTFLGSKTITTDASGNGSFTFDQPTNTFNAYTATIQNIVIGETSSFSQAQSKVISPPPVLYNSLVAVGAGEGGSPQVSVRDQLGNQVYSLTVFDASFTGGVRVAMGDVTGDGANDLIVGTGPGISTQVKIYDGKTQALLQTIDAFESSFKEGVYVAAGDINSDGKAEIFITPDRGGGPRVRVFEFGQTNTLADFFGIRDPIFRGGARVATGDMNKDGVSDVVVSAGFLGGPRIAGYDGKTVRGNGSSAVTIFPDFFIFEDTVRNGAYVAVGDINNDGYADLFGGGGPNGGPRIRGLDGFNLVQPISKQSEIVNFFAGNPENRGGIRIAARLVTGDTRFDIIAADGPGGTSLARMFAGSSLVGGDFTTQYAVAPFGNLPDGVFVG